MSTVFNVRCMRLGDATVSEQTLTALSEAALRQTLAGQGLTVLSVKTTRLKGGRGTAGAGATRGRYALFCREVSTLIQAGMTVVEAVDTLSARERLAGRQDCLAAELLQRLQRGTSLSNALEQLPAAPPVLVAAVRAGERTSDLAHALSDYLKFDTLVEQLRRKVISAAIYPALVTTLGVGISLFLLLVVMPNFARMYTNLRGGADGAGGAGAAGGATGWMIGLSQWVSQHQATALMGVAISMLALAFWVWCGAARRQLLALAQRMPWMRRRMEDFQLAMMYQALALMLKGGYPVTEALAVASRSALDARLTVALGEALTRIEHGGAVAQSLADAQLCDEVGRRLMAAAERNGDFHLAADVVSRMHGERFELFVERLTRIVEPVLLMAVALLVGSIVVMMYLPVFDMATRLR
jgi:general secretion pathway protein F